MSETPTGTASAATETTTRPGGGEPPAPAATDDTLVSAAGDADESEIDESEASEAGRALNKRKRDAQARINEITRKAHDTERALLAAERREAYLMEQNQAYQRQLAAQTPGAPKPPGSPGATVQLPPDLAQYVGEAPNADSFPAGVYDPDYADARADWRARMRIAEQHALGRQNQVRTQQQQAMQTIAAKLNVIVEEGRKAYPDFDDQMAGLGDAITPQLQRVISEIDAPVAARVAGWLAANPVDAAKMKGLSVEALGIRLGGIAAKIAATPPPAKTTGAPAPPAQTARGSGGGGPVDPERMTAKEYYEARMAGRIK